MFLKPVDHEHNLSRIAIAVISSYRVDMESKTVFQLFLCIPHFVLTTGLVKYNKRQLFEVARRVLSTIKEGSTLDLVVDVLYDLTRQNDIFKQREVMLSMAVANIYSVLINLNNSTTIEPLHGNLTYIIKELKLAHGDNLEICRSEYNMLEV